MNLTRTLSAGELLWVALATWGLIVTLRNLLDARTDLHMIYRRKLNGGRRLVARGNVRREGLRVASIGAALLLGLLAGLAPPPGTAAPWAAPWVRPALTLVQPLALLLMLGGGLVGNSYLDRRDRIALLTLLRIVDHYKHQHPDVAALAHTTDYPEGETHA